MKEKRNVMIIIGRILFILVPWIYLYLVELPYYKWFWYFGLHSWGFIVYIIPLFVYIFWAFIGFILSILTYPLHRMVSKGIKKEGFGIINWHFVFNTGLVIFLLITNRIALGFKTSGVLSGASWLHILIGIIASFAITLLVFLPVLSRSKERINKPFRFLPLAIIGVGLFLLSIAFVSPRLIAGQGRLKDKPNVLIITLDTANINYMPGYGSPDFVAPKIAAFIEESILFENAYASVPLTTPSHASIFTGAHPQYHKAYSNESVLSYKARTASDFFKSKGYITGGFPSAYNVSSLNNFNQGFDYFVDRQISDDFRTVIFSNLAPFKFLSLEFGMNYREPYLYENADANLANKRFLRWVNKNQNRRWYAWLHYFDLHAPYLPPSAKNNPRAVEEGDLDKTLEPASVNALTCLYGSRYYAEKNIKAKELSTDDISFIRNLYRGELLNVDSAFGEVLDELKTLGQLDNTIIALIGDHGEGLYERGYFGHNFFLNDDETRIPFVLYIPDKYLGAALGENSKTLAGLDDLNVTGSEKRKIGWNVESIDLLPTIIDYTGLNLPREFRHEGRKFMYGRSLRPLIEFDPEIVPLWKEPALSQTFISSRSVRVGDWKLVWGLNKGDRFLRYNCPEFMLYDIRNDPGERDDLSEVYPDKVEELTGVLEQMMQELEKKRNFKRIPFQDYFEKDSDETEKLADILKGLGYISDASLEKMFSGDWSGYDDDAVLETKDDNCGCWGREEEDKSIAPWELPDEANKGV